MLELIVVLKIETFEPNELIIVPLKVVTLIREEFVQFEACRYDVVIGHEVAVVVLMIELFTPRFVMVELNVVELMHVVV